MKMAIAQMQCEVGNVNNNLKKVLEYIEKAAAGGFDVVIFPEMADTGYDVSKISDYASSWNHGPILHLQKAAEKNRIYVICGLSEFEYGCVYNVLAVVNPEGVIVGKYRKTHLASFPPLDEDKVFAAGNCLETVQIGDFKCGLMICYDLRFPEVARSLALKGAEVLVLSSAWPFPRLKHWDTLIAARAIENQVFVAAANQVGSNSTVTFCGSSKIVDPFGVTVSSASEEREVLIAGEIEKNVQVEVRKAMPVFKHRREKLYFEATCCKHPG
ncbi:MAG: nitrilase-related carbon-nitrogen hydrolase [Desulfobacterales bacterium]